MIVIPAGNPSPWTGPTGNNTYLLPGRVPTLIDAGVGHADHLDQIARALGSQSLGQILITHGHSDHASGAPALIARWPAVRVRKMPPGLPTGVAPLDPLTDRNVDRAGQFSVRQVTSGGRFGEPDSLEDGQLVEAGDTTLRVLWTPGHAPDHCCFLAGGRADGRRTDAASAVVYCGDLIRSGGTIVIAASRGGDLTAYLASLERIRALDPARLLPAHGPAIDDPAAAITAYVRHRATRELQVLRALEDGCHTPAAIAARVYRGLDPALEAAATDTVLAHLVKLERDGKASRVDDGWVAV